MSVFSILSMLGGIAFFLFGMNLMGDGLKSAASNKLESYLWKLSSTPLRGFLLGVGVTAIIQSSSATSIMTVSFVNAGMIKFSQAVCIIIGAQIGTTMTGWILTLADASGTGVLGQLFSTSTIVSLCALIGIGLYLLAKKSYLRHIGMVLLGLGTLLMGMVTISSAVTPLKESAELAKIFTFFSNPIMGILAGTLVAAIVQSCSAGVGILQALCVTGMISYDICIPLILGINVGACVPVLFSMIGSTKAGKRSVLAYLYSNLVSIIIIYALYIPLKIIFDLSFFNNIATVMGIAILNTSLRIITSVVLLPTHKLLERLVYLTIPYNNSENEDEKHINKLEDSLINYTATAIEQSQDTVYRMANISRDNVLRAISILEEYDSEKVSLIQEKEKILDKYEDKLGTYIIKISNGDLNDNQQNIITELLNSIGDLERLGDHAVNLSEVAREIHEKQLKFSARALGELKLLSEAVVEILELTIDVFCNNNYENAYKVEPLEEVLDTLCKELKVRHAKRLRDGYCTITLGFIYNDIINNYERIADHCSNIAFYTLKRNNTAYEAHTYAIKATASPVYQERIHKYQEKYLSFLHDVSI